MNSDPYAKLLKRFEPVLRFTRGEQFFPIEITPYVQTCSLWMQYPGDDPVCLIPEGELNLENLSEPRQHGFGVIYFLKFIEPLNVAELATYKIKQRLKRKDPEDVFHAGRGRLARVGYGSRFVDAIFTLTLLARGRVPGDTAAAAALAYEKMREENEKYCYYGRVIRQNGWIALQYWFFYPFNNWRSGFYGANDHEADWEMIYVYLSEDGQGEIRPAWVAYASHDLSGDDLRRRWDDPELEKVGEHPVIFVGAGSHASYYRPGEYLSEIELPYLAPLVRMVDRFQSFWRRVFHHDRENWEAISQRAAFNIFRIPFVDYARGDGFSIGPGGDCQWDEPGVIFPPPPWALRYRGLWGLYARDPIAGENAPAGPIYDRNGEVRRSWLDPLGWSGLEKVPPPHKAGVLTKERIRELEFRRNTIAKEIEQKSNELYLLGVEAEAMHDYPHLSNLYNQHLSKIATLSEEIKRLRVKYASDGSLLEALDLHSARLQRGETGSARDHIKRARQPASDTGLQESRFAEAWSAISIAILLFSFVGIVLFGRQYLFWGFTTVVAVVIFLEAIFRRQIVSLISGVTIVLAVISGIILFLEFFKLILVVSVLAAGGYILWENIKELYR